MPCPCPICKSPDDDEECVDPITLRVRVPVVVDIDCDDETPREIEGVAVTLEQGPNSLTRTTVGGPDGAFFSAEDLSAAVFVPGAATLTACIETVDGECCTGPHNITLVCGPNATTLPTLVCEYGTKFFPGLSTCPCLGVTFTADYELSDGTTVEVTFTFDATTFVWNVSPSEICVIKKIGGPATIDAITVTSTSRPAVYDIAGATHDGSGGITVPLQPAYVCPCPGTPTLDPGTAAIGPVPRTLYLTDEFGTVELTYEEFVCRDNLNPPTVASVCGWCGKRLNAADPDATVYQDCGTFDGYDEQTADVPIYYRIEPANTKCQRRSTADAGFTWRLVRAAMSREEGGTFHCDGSTVEQRPCAPAEAGTDCADFPNTPTLCCDFIPCIEVGVFNNGTYGIGLTDELFCGDDAVLMEFAITGPEDDPDALMPRFGMEKYSNGSATVTSAAP